MINFPELLEVVVTRWVMLDLKGDRSGVVVDTIVLRGDNVDAVIWVKRCGGARDKRACLIMRMLGRFEMKGGWSHVAKHVLGAHNTLADRLLRWPRSELAGKIRQLTVTSGWNSTCSTLCSRPKTLFLDTFCGIAW